MDHLIDKLNKITNQQYLDQRKECIDAMRKHDLNHGSCAYCDSKENLDHYMIGSENILTDEWMYQRFILVNHTELRCDDCQFLEVWKEKDDDCRYDYPSGDNSFIDGNDYFPVKTHDKVFVGYTNNTRCNIELKKDNLHIIGDKYKKFSTKGGLVRPTEVDEDVRYLRESRDKSKRSTVILYSKN
jgi:hypothetical protein